jgi:hypothetical protein
MNKEIIHQTAQAHAEKSFIQPLKLRRSNVYTYWAYCSVRLQKALKCLKKNFKAGYWYQEQQLKPAAKPLIKKDLRRGSV